MKLLSVGCHPAPHVQIEIYEEGESAYAYSATGMGKGGRKETGNSIYMASKMVILNWLCYHSLSAISLCWFGGNIHFSQPLDALGLGLSVLEVLNLGIDIGVFGWMWIFKNVTSVRPPETAGKSISRCHHQQLL